ncbi:cystathionine beta-lyase [Kordiimonas sp. SCSIO 12603]|uniref:cystathionine beta-lyase n=1 Tax=Kordiimonas sp. SCSIO 12603 TaxID=2829596 RepID=UPI002106BA50|nr:cystathionine beta-lyase [Kordiimonas sp. SCSIO 12603]UTW57721.1 cystathionine beta-lyase [Kordiimonas sp. SCSIO 12603]
MTKEKTETKLVTSGRKKEWTHGVVNPPIYRASTCLFETYAEMRERCADPSARHLFYARKGTPTQWALAEAMTELEGGEGTMLYPSGIAAVTGAIMALVKPGDHILITDSAYDPTRSFANGYLKHIGVETTYYDPLLGSDIETLFKENTTLIVTETPGSLTFEVQDLPAICEAAKKIGAYVITDNTWATPLLLNPLELGADISVHACTKYICGHSDVMMGSATANKRTFKKLQQTAYQMGQTVSPDDAALTLRGLRTLGVRMKEHEENALKIANWIKDHPMVGEVLHPAFENCPGHEIWARDFAGSCGLFSIVLKEGSYEDTAAMVDEMKYFKMGFSWGGYESLILPSNPATCRTATPWKANGPLLRLHIGLENTDDLIEDLQAGLERYSKHLGR